MAKGEDLSPDQQHKNPTTASSSTCGGDVTKGEDLSPDQQHKNPTTASSSTYVVSKSLYLYSCIVVNS